MATKKVLYATDYSDASRHALPVAVSLARDWDATLLIVHVSETELYPVGEAFDEDPEPPEEKVKRLHAVVPDDTSVQVEHRLVFPQPSSTNVSPADEILELANAEHVDVIVLGTHGRSGLSHLLVGSIAESVMRKATCPVVTIRRPPE